LVQVEHKVLQVLKVIQEPKVQLEQQEVQVRVEHKARKEGLVVGVLRVPKVHKVLKVLLVVLEVLDL